MKKNIVLHLINILLCWLLAHTTCVIAQDNLTKLPDVIILKNGTVIRSKVLEIGTQEIKYKRSDQIDGPVYVVYRAEIYAISYGDNTQDYILPPDSTTFYDPTNPQKTKEKEKENSFFKRITTAPSQATAGLGFFEQYSNIDNLEGNFEREGRIFPAVFLGYQVALKNNLYLGLQLGFAWYKFTGGEYASYDELVKDNESKESILSIGVYGKYYFGSGALKPYLIGGIAFNNSSLKTTREVTLVDTEQTLIINSKSKYSSPGVLLRLGGLYQLNEKMGIYGDVGVGVSTLQLGTVFHVK
jgi:hypothetical protein